MKACPISYLAATIALIISGVEATSGQVVTGVPGSPTATTTVDGQQLPAPPGKFGGVIKESAKDSKPYWPPRVVPPKGAPNVLLIMTDDQGYGVPAPSAASSRRRRSTASQGRPALHPVPFDRAVLADARRADHRPQPS